MPSSVCLCTMSRTAWRRRSALPPWSNALAPQVCTRSRRSDGRGRLPACVVRMRSVLCFMASLKRHMRGGDDVFPALGFLVEILRGGLRRAADRFGGQIGKVFLNIGIVQRLVD